jgi:hypothetical protein
MANTINLGTITADGSTTGVFWAGGKGTLVLTGTFGSGTVKLGVSADGTNYALIRADDGFTAAGSANVELAPCWVRLTTTGSTTPSIAAKLISVI